MAKFRQFFEEKCQKILHFHKRQIKQGIIDNIGDFGANRRVFGEAKCQDILHFISDQVGQIKVTQLKIR